MRMRVLTQTSKGKLLTLADEVSRFFEADKKVDVIMPAYPCDGERLVVIVATAKAKMPSEFCRFMKALSRSITANVAFIIDGKPEYAQQIIEMAKSHNSNVIEDNVLYVEGGLPFKFLRGVKPEEIERVRAWAAEIKKSLA